MAHKYSLIDMALRGSRLRREREEQASEPSPLIPQRTPVTTYPCRDCPDKKRGCDFVGCTKYGEYMEYIEAQEESTHQNQSAIKSMLMNTADSRLDD